MQRDIEKTVLANLELHEQIVQSVSMFCLKKCFIQFTEIN